MTERPILFSAPMVRALLDGTKTQTRRIVKPQPPYQPALATHLARRGYPVWHCEQWQKFCPYGQPGDRLWVRETWVPIAKDYKPADLAQASALLYRADGLKVPNQKDREIRAFFADRCRIPLDAVKWRPSIFMPRIASRLDLEIVAVRVERLQDISAADAISEGIEPMRSGWKNYTKDGVATSIPEESYQALWEVINGPDSWHLNPWVWVIAFKRIQP